MCAEIEAKLKVDSHKQIAERLVELGAEFLSEQLQTDSYFDDVNTSLTESDRCIRLRRQLVAGQKKVLLTYKGAKEKDNFKKRREIEFEVADADSAEKLLAVLGYQKISEFEKKRRVWRLGQCLIALDELPLLGSFVEIEGPDDQQIATVQRELGLMGSPHIQESYAFLVAQKVHWQKRQMS